MADPKLPRAALKAAADALTTAGLLNNAGYIAGDEAEAARVALTAAWPLLERAILRDTAKLILLLPGLSSGILCPQCQGRYVTCPDVPNPRYRSERWTCKKGHQWDKPAGPRLTTESLLRLLARGEPLPELPAKESDDGQTRP